VTFWKSYSLPKAGGVELANARVCWERCRAEHRRPGSVSPETRYLGCVEACPGIVVARASACPEHADLCAQVHEERVSGTTALAIVGGLIVAGAVVGAVAAAGGSKLLSKSRGARKIMREGASLAGAIVGAAVNAAQRGAHGAPPSDAPPGGVRCPERAARPAWTGCARRVDNLHQSGETCLYYCLEHCGWHVPAP
jgi:hypothetical protein